jgi:hypothetical protein
MEMSVEFLNDDSSEKEDLPWANEFLEIGGEAGTLTTVTELIPGKKGIILIGKEYKGFLFQGSKLHDFIIAAMPSWKLAKELPFAVVMSVRSSGKIDVGVDHDQSCTVYVDKKGKFSLKPLGIVSSSQESASNPFLPQSLPSTVSGGKEPKIKKSTSPSTPTPF